MKLLLSSFILSTCLLTCNKKCAQTKVVASSNNIIDSLTLKLDATEAQLYNLRVELSKCKGDSIPSEN